MTDQHIVLVQRWQEAANQQNIPLLLALSDPHIEIRGPRGSAYGHDILADWALRAGVCFRILKLFARGDRVVVEQHGEWRSPETGAVIGEAQVATSFCIAQQRITRLARYDSLEQALDDGLLSQGDYVPLD